MCVMRQQKKNMMKDLIDNFSRKGCVLSGKKIEPVRVSGIEDPNKSYRKRA